ncbi:MAG TPA: NAD(P)-dependent oxidoreductase [Jiangellaceae bacterium]|nr:NAD(P)-dependent oxidoreductase [Jiangellaceae bacterium]
MRIFLAGATGVLGRHLMPALVEAGHEVIGTTRAEAKAGAIRAAGAEPIVLDALDREAVLRVVTEASPDVVIHQLTAIARADFKRFDEAFAATNELRTRGLDYLLEAARKAGAKRFIAQSYTGWPNPHTGSTVKTEDDPLDPAPAAASVKSLAAIRHVETTVPAAQGIEGLVLRYGSFYGPGTSFDRGGEIYDAVAKRRMPIVGGGAGVFSFIHIKDTARITAIAVERGRPGVYNIVDDDPAPVSTWLPHYAKVIGAKKPFQAPAWLVRPMLGEFGVATMTTMRGSANGKAKAEFGWTPSYPSWRDGFRELGAA